MKSELEKNFESKSYLDKDQHFLVLNKAGFIMPLTVKTKKRIDENADDKISFVTSFKQESQPKNYIYFIIDNTDVGSDHLANHEHFFF